MNIFSDTEFTGLTYDPHLLSMGFVAENGATLYIELADGWLESECTPWVKQHVLPQLGKGEQLSRREAARRLTDWLATFEPTPVLLGDSDYDTILVADLLLKAVLRRMHLSFNSWYSEAKHRRWLLSLPKNGFLHCNPRRHITH